MTNFLRWLTHGVHRHDGDDDAADSFERIDSAALDTGAFRASGSMGLQPLAPAATWWSPLGGRAAAAPSPARARAAARVDGGAAGA